MLLPPQKCELLATERFHLCLSIIYFVCGFYVIFLRSDCLADLLSGNRLCPACCPYPNFLGRISSLILTITLHRVSHEMPKKNILSLNLNSQVTLAHHFFLNPSSELRNATLKLVLILIHTSQLSLTVNYFLLISDIIQTHST